MGMFVSVAARIHGCACPASERISVLDQRVLPEGAGFETVNFAACKIDCAFRNTPNIASRSSAEDGIVPAKVAFLPTGSMRKPTPLPAGRPGTFPRPAFPACSWMLY